MVLKICVICECQFEAKTSEKACSENCKKQMGRAKRLAAKRAHYYRHRDAILQKQKQAIANDPIKAAKARERLLLFTENICPEEKYRMKSANYLKNKLRWREAENQKRRVNISLRDQSETLMALLAAEES